MSFWLGTHIAPNFNIFSYQILPVVIIPVTICVAAWSVFGAHSYLHRILISHGVGLTVLLALAMGAREHIDWPIVSISVFPVSIVTQLPFWFFRSFFGVQLTRNNQQPNSGLTIRDIFTVMLVVGLAIASVQLGAKIMTPQFTENYMFTHPQTGKQAAMIVKENGIQKQIVNVSQQSAAFVEKKVQQQVNAELWATFFRLFFVNAVVALLGVPLVFAVLQTASNRKRIFSVLVYILVPILLAYTGWSAYNRQLLPDIVVSYSVFQFFLVPTLVETIVLGLICWAGYSLTSPRRYATRATAS
ncbi:MAG: hypothetical protein AB8B55_15950 [Mariniblastus sp.]